MLDEENQSSLGPRAHERVPGGQTGIQVHSDGASEHRQNTRAQMTQTQTPIVTINEQEIQQSRRVTIQESDENRVGPSAPLRRSGTMRLWSALPEIQHLSSNQEPSIVRKPQGEPGRPNAGGHNVEGELSRLDWSKAQYNALYVSSSLHPVLSCSYSLLCHYQDAVKAQASERLNTSKSFRYQKQEVVRAICELVRNSLLIFFSYSYLYAIVNQ